MAVEYVVRHSPGAITVTVYPDLPSLDRGTFGVELDESDLILLLSEVQGVDAYTPDPRTGEL